MVEASVTLKGSYVVGFEGAQVAKDSRKSVEDVTDIILAREKDYQQTMSNAAVEIE